MKKVWHRGSENGWYLTIRENGHRRQLLLVKGPNTREFRKKAEELAIAELATRKVDDCPSNPSWLLVHHVLDGFLKHSLEEHEPKTHDWYKGFFDTFEPKYGKLRVVQLKKQHVMAWVTARGFNDTSANRAIGALKRAFAWAVEEEHISRSPIDHLRKPRTVVRDRVLTPEERQLILASIRDAQFRDYVSALSLTGCRPGEVVCVTRDDVDLEQGIWVLRKHKTVKKTGKPRIIYLCPDALALTKRLIAQHTDGPLFRNTRGRPWTKNAVRLRFTKLRKLHPELKGVVAYTYRSSFATDALEQGVPDATVATLMGHTNTNTLHRFYARLSHKVEHLKEAAAKAIPPAKDAAPPDTAP